MWDRTTTAVGSGLSPPLSRFPSLSLPPVLTIPPSLSHLHNAATRPEHEKREPDRCAIAHFTTPRRDRNTRNMNTTDAPPPISQHRGARATQRTSRTTRHNNAHRSTTRTTLDKINLNLGRPQGAPLQCCEREVGANEGWRGKTSVAPTRDPTLKGRANGSKRQDWRRPRFKLILSRLDRALVAQSFGQHELHSSTRAGITRTRPPGGRQGTSETLGRLSDCRTFEPRC